jgi:acyl-CoA synthetase (NDP forming)
MQRSPEAIFRPQSVAIVGASDSAANGWSKTLFDNLRLAGFPGRVYLINPRRASLWDAPCFPDFAHVPEPVDVALVVVGARAVPAILAEGRAHGLRSAVLYASGFREADDGSALARVAALCAGDGLRVSGPNGMGTIAFRERAIFYTHARIRNLPAGDAGVIFSSGGSLQHWLRQAAMRGLGFSYAVSSGDEVDLDAADYVDFLVDDPHTRVICLLMEGLRRPRAFMRAARRALEARKPIAIVKIGRSRRAQVAAASHTGALAVDDALFDAMCERFGIVRVPTLDDLIEAALALRAGRVPAGPRVGMICHSGGIKGLFLDEAEQLGVELATFSDATIAALATLEPEALGENPFDAGATLAENSVRFKAVCAAILDDPGIDLFALQGRLPTDTPGQHPAEMYADIAAGSEKPVIAFERMTYNLTTESRDFQAAATVPFLHGVASTVRALAGLVRYGARLRRGVPKLCDELPATRSEGPADDAIRAVLHDGGATLPAEALAGNEDEAVAAARRIGFPVVLKAVARGLVHKTEADGVRVDLRDADAVAAAARDFRRRLDPEAFLVQEMVPPGVEMLVGAREDAQFGPVLVVGLGGVAAEVFRDVAVRLLPADAGDVESMLRSLRSYAALGAFRGRAERDVAALVAAALAVGRTFEAHRASIADLEINPLIVGARGSGVRAVDVRIVARS